MTNRRIVFRFSSLAGLFLLATVGVAPDAWGSCPESCVRFDGHFGFEPITTCSTATQRDTSVDSSSPPGYYSGGAFDYDLSAGHMWVSAGASSFGSMSVQLTTRDVYRIVEIAAGTPVDFVVRVILSGSTWGSCYYDHCSSGSFSGARISEGTNSASARQINSVLEMPLQKASEEDFTIEFWTGVGADGGAGPGGSAEVRARLEFAGLPQGGP